MAAHTRRRFLFLVGSAAPGVWLAGCGLLELARRFVIALGGSCSFCGRAAHQAGTLAGVVTRPTRICDGCVDLCCEILSEDALHSSETNCHPPADEVVADDDLSQALRDLEGAPESRLESLIADVRRRLDGERSRRAPDFQCSFCDKLRTDVPKLISGPRVFICDGCVADAAALVSRVLRA